MFCAARTNPPFQYSFKVEDEEFEPLCDLEGIRPAPYLARAKWIYLDNPQALSLNESKERLRKSYDLVKAKLSKSCKSNSQHPNRGLIS